MGNDNREETTIVRNPELACDDCGDEVANGEGVMIGDDRVCSECAEAEKAAHAKIIKWFADAGCLDA